MLQVQLRHQGACWGALPALQKAPGAGRFPGVTAAHGGQVGCGEAAEVAKSGRQMAAQGAWLGAATTSLLLGLCCTGGKPLSAPKLAWTCQQLGRTLKP